MFDRHATHVDSATAPTDVEYLPDPQFAHAADPAFALYFPAAHRSHGPPFGPFEPALQVQSNCASLPASEFDLGGQARHDVASTTAPTDVEYLPVAQSAHAAVPGRGLYLPATHCVQGPPSAPVEPALQVQSTCASLPAGELAFPGQI